jgi:WhiB family redox-sensing transcriptional regulator
MNPPHNQIEIAATERDERSWRDLASCRQTDDELFPPEPDRPTTTAAKKVCARCPVQAACLAEAIRRREPHGVWGGMTPNERRAYARHLRRGSAA